MKEKGAFVFHEGCISCGHKQCAQKVSLFDELDDDQLEKVMSLIKKSYYKKGEIIFNVGDKLDRLYILNSGSIKISSINSDGKEQILYMLQEGEFIGDLALLKTSEVNYSATALTDTHICTIANEAYLDLMINNKEILIATLAYAHDRIESLERLIQIVSTADADERLNYLLNLLAESTGIRSKDEVVIKLMITREDMANFVGVSRETISRKLSKLNREGKIEIIDQRTIKLFAKISTNNI